MNYDEHYPFPGLAGPVASQDWFTDNLRAAVKVIPQDKLISAIGNYETGSPPSALLTALDDLEADAAETAEVLAERLEAGEGEREGEESEDGLVHAFAEREPCGKEDPRERRIARDDRHRDERPGIRAAADDAGDARPHAPGAARPPPD